MISPAMHRVAHVHQRTLVDAGVLVGALELAQAVDVDARLGGVGLFRRADDDTRCVDLVDDAGAARSDGGARVARHDLFHAGADERRFRLDQRHGLTLHVRAHQRAVGVVVLEERDERGGDRHELLRRHVDVVDLVGRHEQHVAVEAAGDEIAGQLALGIDLGVGLGDVVAHLFHGREIRRPRRSPCRPSTLRYGLSMKPYLLTRANVASELMRPMFGPSGVSIGQMRP